MEKSPLQVHISSPNVLKRRRRHTKRNKTTFENDDDDKSKDEKRAKEDDDDDDKGAMKKSSGGSFQNLQGKHEEEETSSSNELFVFWPTHRTKKCPSIDWGDNLFFLMMRDASSSPRANARWAVVSRCDDHRNDDRATHR